MKIRTKLKAESYAEYAVYLEKTCGDHFLGYRVEGVVTYRLLFYEITYMPLSRGNTMIERPTVTWTTADRRVVGTHIPHGTEVELPLLDAERPKRGECGADFCAKVRHMIEHGA